MIKITLLTIATGLLLIIVVFGLLNTFGKKTLSREEIISILEDFVSENDNAWGWDDFISVELKNNDAEKVRREVLKVECDFPSLHGNSWCSDEGLKKIVLIHERLINEAW